MIIGYQQELKLKVFRDYIPAIRHLEAAFEAAGMEIKFELMLTDSGKKRVLIDEGIRPTHNVCIEGCNPIMALKEI